MCYWDSQASLFQLLAGLFFGYAIGSTTFLKGLDSYIFKFYEITIEKFRADKLKNAASLDEINYYNETFDKNLKSLSQSEDVLGKEVEAVRERYISIFLLSFFACSIFLMIAGFERYYTSTDPKTEIDLMRNEIIHKRVCGLVILNFLQIWVFQILVWNRKKNLNTVSNEVTSGNHQTPKPFLFFPNPTKTMIFHLFWVFFAILFVTHLSVEDADFFSKNDFRWIFLLGMITTILPFIMQVININVCKKPYYLKLKEIVREPSSYQKITEINNKLEGNTPPSD